jgi:hypothetical protein
MKPPSKEPLIVTDHSVLRYFQRHYGFDMELIRKHIHGICADAAAFGAVCVRAEGLRFEIVDNRVVTVSPDGALPSRTGKKLAAERGRA